MEGLCATAVVYGDTFRPGDRFEVDVAPDGITASPLLIDLLHQFGVLVGPDGNPVVVDIDRQRGRIVVDGLREQLPEKTSSVWLELDENGALHVRSASSPSAPAWSSDADGEWVLESEHGLPRLLDRPPGSLDDFALARRAIALSAHGGFDQLMCLPLLRDMEILEHQTRTAKTVLQRFRGRALLCDEVGLGKTIEAGIILAELRLRGLVRSILILTPPSLVAQWQGELQRKFSVDVIPHDAPEFRSAGPEAWMRFDRIIASMHTAKREPHRSAIQARRWDLVIVDEAHHMRNRSTQLWKLVNELKKQFVLLLTATPVQNHLEELFNLVTVLEPGLLSTSKKFQQRFVDRRDKLSPKNVDELHGLLANVMVRNRRSTVGLRFTRRWARTDRVSLSPQERSLYNAVAAMVRDGLRGGTDHHVSRRSGVASPPSSSEFRFHRMTLLALQMAMGSSSRAAAGTLAKMAGQPRVPDAMRPEIERMAAAAEGVSSHAKVDRLLQLLAEFDDKMVVFTQFLATQRLLEEALLEAGHDVAVFHGGLTRLEKEAAIDEFREKSRVLLCSEAGSEGRNLQFAHAICNFDLPWNPMKIEQRIGRLSRIGQRHDVHVFNLVASGTVEDAILHLLDAKLAMFELVVGEIDMVLGNLDADKEFQEIVADEWAASDDIDDFQVRMDRLGDRLLAAKSAYLRQREHDDRIFGDRFTPS